MKKLIFSAVLIALAMTSCNHKSKEAETHNPEMMNHDSTMVDDDSKMMDGDSKIYACSMHPEVTGKKGDKCTKCGMKLTEKVNK
jgi:hypothetical protein